MNIKPLVCTALILAHLEGEDYIGYHIIPANKIMQPIAWP